MPNDYDYSEVGFSFMVAGPTFRIAVPNYCNSVPELSTPLGNRNGARSFDFLPHWQPNQISPDFPMIRTISDRGGRTVELYRWLEEPPQWFLRWPLTNGNLWTHLRPEDGEEMAETTVTSVSIVEDPATGLPFIFPATPLRSAVSPRPGYQEFCAYLAPERPGWAVSVQRPSHVSEGRMMAGPGARDQVVLRMGARHGAEVQVIAMADIGEASKILDEVVASFREE